MNLPYNEFSGAQLPVRTFDRYGSNKIHIIDLNNDLSVGEHVQTLRNTVQKLLREKDKRALNTIIALNMSGVEHMDSSGIAELSGSATGCSREGMKFALINVQPNPMRMLEIAKMHTEYKIFESEDKLVAYYKELSEGIIIDAAILQTYDALAMNLKGSFLREAHAEAFENFTQIVLQNPAGNLAINFSELERYETALLTDSLLNITAQCTEKGMSLHFMNMPEILDKAYTVATSFKIPQLWSRREPVLL